MITAHHAGGKLGGVGHPDISLDGVLLDGACRRLAPIKQGGAQGAPRDFDSGLQVRISSESCGSRAVAVPSGYNQVNTYVRGD